MKTPRRLSVEHVTDSFTFVETEQVTEAFRPRNFFREVGSSNLDRDIVYRSIYSL
jgi:hypothetical protein